VESNTTVQYQSYNIFLGFQFLVYEKVERIFLIISDYLKQKADACRQNVSQIHLEVSYHRLAGWRLATNRLPSRDGARPLANQSVRGRSRVDAASKKKYAFACCSTQPSKANKQSKQASKQTSKLAWVSPIIA
jgi:hypothetical protein